MYLNFREFEVVVYPIAPSTFHLEKMLESHPSSWKYVVDIRCCHALIRVRVAWWMGDFNPCTIPPTNSHGNMRFFLDCVRIRLLTDRACPDNLGKLVSLCCRSRDTAEALFPYIVCNLLEVVLLKLFESTYLPLGRLAVNCPRCVLLHGCSPRDISMTVRGSDPTLMDAMFVSACCRVPFHVLSSAISKFESTHNVPLKRDLDEELSECVRMWNDPGSDSSDESDDAVLAVPSIVLYDEEFLREQDGPVSVGRRMLEESVGESVLSMDVNDDESTVVEADPLN